MSYVDRRDYDKIKDLFFEESKAHKETLKAYYALEKKHEALLETRRKERQKKPVVNFNSI